MLVVLHSGGESVSFLLIWTACQAIVYVLHVVAMVIGMGSVTFFEAPAPLAIVFATYLFSAHPLHTMGMVISCHAFLVTSPASARPARGKNVLEHRHQHSLQQV
jgi:hypothetical protein